MEPLTLLFVYGTLKQNFFNHNRYLREAELHGNASYLYQARTVVEYPLVIRPRHLPPATCGPVLMDLPGTGEHIDGEVFEVNPACLEAMDILEGVRSGAYYQKTISVERISDAVATDGEISSVECVAYFYPPKEELLAARPYLSCYDRIQHQDALYTPAATVNREILELCQSTVHT